MTLRISHSVCHICIVTLCIQTSINKSILQRISPLSLSVSVEAVRVDADYAAFIHHIVRVLDDKFNYFILVFLHGTNHPCFG